MATQTTANTSVIRNLRAVMPARALTYAEACHVAEVQAGRLLALHGVSAPPVPHEVVTELPRLRVEQTYDIPVSGSAHWDGTAWVVTLNAADYKLRQRFSLMHEFKHVIDHPFMRFSKNAFGDQTEALAERIADYFAACVLMPRAWVKGAFCGGSQSVEKLAATFGVSQKAMRYRLDQLGLTGPTARCRTSWPPSSPTDSPWMPHVYHRPSPTYGATA